MVDAIESAFVPFLVKNNGSGNDAKLLKHFREPAWNYQVIRFLDGNGKDLIPRKDRVWSIGALATRMIAALGKANRPVPNFLQALSGAYQTPSETAQIALAMHCFWTGEMRLGQFDGVLTTEAGWIDGREVTLVTYDPTRLSLESLVKKAHKESCAAHIYLGKAPKGLQFVRNRRWIFRAIIAKRVLVIKSGNYKVRALQGSRFRLYKQRK